MNDDNYINDVDNFVLQNAIFIAEKHGCVIKELNMENRLIYFDCGTYESELNCSIELETILGKYSI